MTWDTEGSLIGAVRLDPAQACGDVPGLLERTIKQGDDAAWALLKQRIDYVYDRLGYAVAPVLKRDDLRQRIRAEVEAGRKLFFKPNVVTATVLDFPGDGTPGLTTAVVAATPWTFMAALLRFFHDELGIRFCQMAVGEAGVTTGAYASILACPPEAVLEGRIQRPDGEVTCVGYPFYFVRRYLAEQVAPLDARDDPMSGYAESVSGTYLTPGEATRRGRLMMYDLNQAELPGRGRLVPVPDGGDNYPEGVLLHTALVGDPDEPEGYPGSVLVNCPVLKVHCNSVITSAIKNLGIGGWPMRARHGDDPNDHDWLYAFPHADPPGMKGGVPGGPNKGGVYHACWYVKKVNAEGMPLEIAETPNRGLDGTMVDINLAIRSQIPCALHVVDAIRPVNIEHGGNGTGVALDEGLILASEDPVAVDLFSARYLFKTVPRSPAAPATFERPLLIPRYDEALGAIVDEETVMDARVSRSRLFDYAAGRGLGQVDYHVEGTDVTAADTASGGPVPLVTLDGHFGKVRDGRFEDVVTREFYYDVPKILWDLQPIMLAHARATDALTLAALGSDSGYLAEFMALDEDGDGVVDDSESGTTGLWDCQCAGGGIGLNLQAHGHTHHGNFHGPSRILKFADKAWNADTSGGTRHSVDTMRIGIDSIAFTTAMDMSRGEPATDTFFDIPIGTGADDRSRWPSLQFARYVSEAGMIRDVLYPEAKAHAEETGQEFTLFVPDAAPYFPSASYDPDGLPGIVAISDKELLPNGEANPQYDPDFAAKVFTVRFQNGERW